MLPTILRQSVIFRFRILSLFQNIFIFLVNFFDFVRAVRFYELPVGHIVFSAAQAIALNLNSVEGNLSITYLLYADIIA